MWTFILVASISLVVVSLVTSDGTATFAKIAVAGGCVGAFAAGCVGALRREVLLPASVLCVVPLLGLRAWLDLVRARWDGGIMDYWGAAAVIGVGAVAVASLLGAASEPEGSSAPPPSPPPAERRAASALASELVDLAANVPPRAPDTLKNALRGAEDALARLDKTRVAFMGFGVVWTVGVVGGVYWRLQAFKGSSRFSVSSVDRASEIRTLAVRDGRRMGDVDLVAMGTPRDESDRGYCRTSLKLEVYDRHTGARVGERSLSTPCSERLTDHELEPSMRAFLR